MKVIWVAGYGPDRSHDNLHSEVFGKKGDAEAFVKGRSYWRISRLEYAAPFSKAKRTDEIGGADVDAQVERVRQQMEYETMRRVTDKQALTRWRQLMRSRHGPGGRMANPRAIRLNDRERELWVLNDEGLYRDWKFSRLSMRAYLRQNRGWLDKLITGAVTRSNPRRRRRSRR